MGGSHSRPVDSASLFGIDSEAFMKMLQNVETELCQENSTTTSEVSKIVHTALAIVFLEEMPSVRVLREEWELLAAKAREWLRLHSTLDLPTLFARLRSCLYNHK